MKKMPRGNILQFEGNRNNYDQTTRIQKGPLLRTFSGITAQSILPKKSRKVSAFGVFFSKGPFRIETSKVHRRNPEPVTTFSKDGRLALPIEKGR
ncbi:MAG: hypothetical protein CM15mP120_23090 [Pseudomonadota bacterium]|nr:MAG: hypothetical protein CM15mP120_23090 [Pseudomonadota bacterium]